MSTAEFAKMLGVVKETTAPREEDSFLETSKYNLVLAGEGEESQDYPTRVNSELHDVLSFHVPFCSCQHLTRLRLNPRDCIQERGAICFEMLFSAIGERTKSLREIEWMETKMLVPRYQRPITRPKLSMGVIDI